MVQTICICGAGTMGSGIGQTSAQAGFYTILYELNKTVLEKAKTNIEESLQKLVEKNKLTAGEKEKTIQRILFTNDLHHCLGDIIIEAIVERQREIPCASDKDNLTRHELAAVAVVLD